MEIIFFIILQLVSQINSNDSAKKKSVKLIEQFISHIDNKYNLESDEIYSRIQDFKDLKIIESTLNINIANTIDSITTKRVFKKCNKTYLSYINLDLYFFKRKEYAEIIKQKFDSISISPYQLDLRSEYYIPQYYILVNSIIVVMHNYYSDQFEDIKSEVTLMFPENKISIGFFADYHNIIPNRPDYLYDTLLNEKCK